jgi:parallel beta helix pectate lyase-like protein/thrombospondin type 3 repeat protein
MWALLAVLTIAAIVVLPAPPEAREPDRDSDGLSNRFELKRSHTNPRKRDTDGDGLGDRFELRRSHTNPRRRDTDADGLPDRVEVRRGSDPRRASWKCDRKATSEAGLASEFRAARPGQTVCLASGSYGVFRGGAKRGLVTVRAQPAASPSLSLELDGASNIRLEDLTITEGILSGGTRNVTVARSRFTGILIVDQDTPHPNIVLDRNTHNDIPGAADDYTSRVHLDAPGVVVKNSLFSGGTSDGIRVGDAPDTKILRNEFTAFVDQDPLHTDPIQFYGHGPRTVIRGNWFHHMESVSALIMMADGGGPNVIEGNLFGPGGNHFFSLTYYSDDGSIIRHNTFVADRCKANLRCGIINLGYKPGDDAGRGTVIEDNVLTSISADGNGEGGGASAFSSSHNLLRGQRPIGRGDLRGAPRYAGAPLASPDVGRAKAFAAYRLARGSRGRGNASDGTDRGIP